MTQIDEKALDAAAKAAWEIEDAEYAPKRIFGAWDDQDDLTRKRTTRTLRYAIPAYLSALPPPGDVGEPAERQFRYRLKAPNAEWGDWQRYVGEINESMLAHLDVETRELYPADALASLSARAERLAAALKDIASCKSYHPGDVVSIARAALSDSRHKGAE